MPLPTAITAAPAAASAPTVDRVIFPVPAELMVKLPSVPLVPAPTVPSIATAPLPLTSSKARV